VHRTDDPADVTLRPAEAGDAEAIAELHVAVWRATYGKLAPEHCHRILDVPYRLARWHEILSAPTPDRAVLIAQCDGRLAGFGMCGAPGDPAFGTHGEIKHLYVGRDWRRRGIGRLLLGAMASRLRDLGYSGVALGVVAENRPARTFYEALGGIEIGAYTDPGPHWRSRNLIYAWSHLDALPQASGYRSG
jgi:ribosomal protein S18 acetylase RimI-like enzyme